MQMACKLATKIKVLLVHLSFWDACTKQYKLCWERLVCVGDFKHLRSGEKSQTVEKRETRGSPQKFRGGTFPGNSRESTEILWNPGKNCGIHRKTVEPTDFLWIPRKICGTKFCFFRQDNFPREICGSLFAHTALFHTSLCRL